MQIEESNVDNLLTTTFDKVLSFKKHVQMGCAKASQKLHAITRISIYVKTNYLKLLIGPFAMPKRSYCLLIWMFHDRKLNNEIIKMHEYVLSIAYKGDIPSFEIFLAIDNLVTVHWRKLQLLMTEICNMKYDSNPSFMKQIFEEKVLPYILRCSD